MQGCDVMYTPQTLAFFDKHGVDLSKLRVEEPSKMDGRPFGYDGSVEYYYTRLPILGDGLLTAYDFAQIPVDPNGKTRWFIKGGGTSLAEGNLVTAQRVINALKAIGAELPRDVIVTSQEGGLPRIRLNDLGVELNPAALSLTRLKYNIGNAKKLLEALYKIVPSLRSDLPITVLAYSAGFKGGLELAAGQEDATVIAEEPVGNLDYASNLEKEFGANPFKANKWHRKEAQGLMNRVLATLNVFYGLAEGRKAWVTPKGKASLGEMVFESLLKKEPRYTKPMAHEAGFPKELDHLLQSCRPNIPYLTTYDPAVMRAFVGTLIGDIGLAGISIFQEPTMRALNNDGISYDDAVKAFQESDIKTLKRMDALATAVITPYFHEKAKVIGIVHRHHMHFMSNTEEQVARLYGLLKDPAEFPSGVIVPARARAALV